MVPASQSDTNSERESCIGFCIYLQPAGRLGHLGPKMTGQPTPVHGHATGLHWQGSKVCDVSRLALDLGILVGN